MTHKVLQIKRAILSKKELIRFYRIINDSIVGI